MNNVSETTLGDLIEFQRGYDLPQSSFIKGKIPVVSSNGILGYHNEYKVLGPGITIGRSGTVGLPQYIECNYFPHNTALFVKDFKGNYPKYIYYLLKALGLNKKKSGSGVPTMNRNHLHPLKVLAHLDLSIQKKIAITLSILDAKIELNNRTNAELEAMAKMLYDYWFVQFDFPDKNGKPYKSSGGKMVWNDQLKREIPEGWKCFELSKIISRISTGLNPRKNFILGDGSNYYVTIKNIDYGKLYIGEKCDKIDDEALRKINKRSDLQIGDILFTSIEPVGITYLIQEKPENWNINESVFTIKPNYTLATTEYVYLLLSSEEIRAFTKNVSAGSIHKGVRIGVLNTFKVAYGDRKIISDFSKIIKPILKKTNILEKENQKLSELRDWLLPILMNGQVEVRSRNMTSYI